MPLPILQGDSCVGRIYGTAALDLAGNFASIFAMRWKRFWAFILGIVLFVVGMDWLKTSHQQWADTLLSVITPVGLIIAVAFATYGDRLKMWFNPIDLCIEILPPEERSQHLDSDPSNDYKRNYCHHLRVRNLSSHVPLNNCRVWLKKIFILNAPDSGKPTERLAFSVPRLMEWAPSEYSRDKRTFVTSEVFDFGTTWREIIPNMESGAWQTRYGFTFTIDRDQIAAKEILRSQQEKFGVGATIECVLYATADNYNAQKEFRFRIVVKELKGSEDGTVVEVSEISPVK